MIGIGEILVLLIAGLMMTGGGLLVAWLVRGAGSRRSHAEARMLHVREALERLNSRLNDVDERLADMTLMIDETSRASVRAGGSPPRDRS